MVMVSVVKQMCVYVLMDGMAELPIVLSVRTLHRLLLLLLEI